MFALLRFTPAAVAAALVAVVGSWNPTHLPAAQPRGAAKALAFRNFTLYTGTDDKPVPDAVLVVRDGKIEAVGANADVGIPNDAEAVDLEGAVVIPGLVDTHSHIGVWSRPGVAANSD